MSRKTKELRKHRRALAGDNGESTVHEPEVLDSPIEIEPTRLSSTALVSGGFIPHLRDELHNTFSEAAERCTAAVDRLKKLSTAQAEFYEKMAALAEEKHREEVKLFKERGL
jgi:hypothetical protein